MNTTQMLWRALTGLLGVALLSSSVGAQTGPTMDPSAPWWSEYFTVPNTLLIATWAMHLGMVRQQFKDMQKRIDEFDDIYARRDLVSVELRLIHQALSDIRERLD